MNVDVDALEERVTSETSARLAALQVEQVEEAKPEGAAPEPEPETRQEEERGKGADKRLRMRTALRRGAV